MRTQVQLLSTLLLVHFVSSNEMSFFKSSRNAQHARQFKSNNMSTRKIVSSQPATSPPIQYLKTPDYDIMLLKEDNSNPTWRKYSELFQPKDMRNVPHIEVNYGNHENCPHPFIDLDRSDIEAILASLGNKKHIFVLHPRNCKPHSSCLDEFENEFLPELLQKLHKPQTTTAIGASNLDPVIDRILSMLDNDEQKILDDLRKTFDKSTFTNVNNSPQIRRGPGPSAVINKRPNGVSNAEVMKDQHEPRTHQATDFLYKVPCNEEYVFLVESQKNSDNPSALNDLLLRVMKVVTEMS